MMKSSYKQFSLAEWLGYLENRHQQEIQLGLERIRQVANRLDLLRPQAKVITVAGTNGKGSTVAALEAIYSTAAYQVASYTSPHLLAFNERIRVNQQQILDQELCKAFCAIEEGRGDIPLTYFEMATLAALWHFKQLSLDLIILEVGLGGRLDATNIIDSNLAIITTIDFDHQDLLGDSKEKIGYEKAGILRTDKPFIYADINPPSSILNQASLLKVPVYQRGYDYDYRVSDRGFDFIYSEGEMNFDLPRLHYNSVAAALMASLLLKEDFALKNEHLQAGLKNLFLAGRLQRLGEKVVTLLDVSHNSQAVEHLAKYIDDFHPRKRVHAVFAALKDKDLAGLIAPLRACVDHWYTACLKGKRAASAQQLAEAFALSGEVPPCYPDPLAAYQSAFSQAKAGDLIIVYGSFLTVAAVLGSINNCG